MESKLAVKEEGGIRSKQARQPAPPKLVRGRCETNEARKMGRQDLGAACSGQMGFVACLGAATKSCPFDDQQQPS